MPSILDVVLSYTSCNCRAGILCTALELIANDEHVAIVNKLMRCLFTLFRKI